jgi:hypothetical protein
MTIKPEARRGSTNHDKGGPGGRAKAVQCSNRGDRVATRPLNSTNLADDIAANSLILLVGAQGLEPWTR